jgi:hypothetical protein
MLDPSSIDHPIFLVGAERSGSTLLRLMLDHHPDVAFHHEAEFMVSQMGKDGGWPDLTAYREWLREDRVFLHSRFEIDESLDYPSLMRSFLKQKQQRDCKPVVGATVHYNFHHLLKLWPQARFIHILRDPRDVARSTVQMGWAGNLWCGAEQWLEAETTWDSLVNEIDESRYIEVRYLDLIQDCVATLVAICRFLGIEYSSAMLSYHKDTTYLLPDPTLVRQWKLKANALDVRLVEAKVGEFLTARGYEPSGLPSLHVSLWRQRYFRWQSHLARARFRFRRYGPKIYFLELLARRLRLKTLMGRVRPEIRRIDEGSIR